MQSKLSGLATTIFCSVTIRVMLRKILREHAQRSWGFLPEQGDNQRGISLFGSRPPPFYNTEPPLGGLWYKTMKGWGSFTNDVSLTTSVSQKTRRRGKAARPKPISSSPPLFFQPFFGWYGKVSKMPNKFNIFQNDLRTDIVLNGSGCEGYRSKLAEIYGGSVLVRSFFRQ
jgi:hypothetical protein